MEVAIHKKNNFAHKTISDYMLDYRGVGLERRFPHISVINM